LLGEAEFDAADEQRGFSRLHIEKFNYGISLLISLPCRERCEETKPALSLIVARLVSKECA
jgi:hypothetical protein